ncbi:MAG TPA: hypothetical protein VLA46_05815, partial [Saprospiraceae bacterium]|nr:hypothetical protein [Saprospiraceae bacterium]
MKNSTISPLIKPIVSLTASGRIMAQLLFFIVGMLCSESIFAQNPCGITPCTSHVTIIDLDATTGPNVVPICSSGTTIQIAGNIEASQTDCESDIGTRPTCPGNPPKNLSCFNFRIIRSTNSVYQQFKIKIGQGAGCNGELDYASQVINGVCTQLACGGSGNIVTITFPVGVNQVDFYGCLNSSASVYICNLCKSDPPCTTLPECILTNVNTTGCQADVPPVYTQPSQVFSNTGTCSATLRMRYTTTGDSLFCTAPYGVNFTRTYTLEFFDAVQNLWFPYRTCVQTVVVTPPAPMAICKNITVALDPGTNTATIMATQINNGSTGACITLSATPTSFTCANLGNNNVVLTVTDQCGRTSTCMSVVTITAVMPTADAGPSAANVCTNASYTAAATATNGTILWSTSGTGTFNNNTLEDVTYTPSGTDISNGSVVLTMKVTGACNQMASDFITLTFIPAPSCTITGANAVCANSMGNIYTSGSATGNVWTITSGNGTIAGSNTDQNVTVTAGAAGSFTLSLTVTAANGCTSTCTKVVTVNANPTCSITGPDAVCVNSIGNLFSAPPGMTTYAWSITGNGSIPGATNMQNVSVTAGAAGSFTLTLVLTDANNCTSTCMKTVNVTANPESCIITGPTTVCPGTSNQHCTTTVGDTYSWAVSGGGTISGSNSGMCVTITAASGCNTSYTVSLTVTTNGCSSICSQVVSVVDNTPPSITCPPANLTLECNATGDFTIPNNTTINNWLLSATGSDACGTVVITNNYSATGYSDLCGATGVQVVTFTATDACGLTSTCTKTITIVDTTPPSITCPPANLTLECNATGDFTIPNNTTINNWLLSATGSDACGTVVITNNYSATGYSDLCGATGVQVVTFTATDACGLTSTCTKTITIVDTTPPSITCPPANLTLECNATGDFTIPN